MLAKGGQRFRLELRAIGTGDSDLAYPVILQHYRQVGIETSYADIVTRDLVEGALYPGFRFVGGVVNQVAAFSVFHSKRIASAETRYAGVNFGGYNSPGFDRAVDAIDRAVRPEDYMQRWGEARRALTEDAALIGLYTRPSPYIVRKGITGPLPVAPTGSRVWNIQRWDVQ